MKNRKFLRIAIFYGWIFIACVPLLVLAVLTVSTFWPYPALFPQTISLEYFNHVFIHNQQTQRAMLTSITLAFVSALIALLIGVPAAKAIAHYQFRGKKIIKILALLPMIMPTIAITMGIQISMIRLQLAGTFLGVALVHALFALPFAIRIMSNVFQIAGNQLEHQATVLGAHPMLIWRKITLPQIMPGIIAVASISFTISISQYITTLIIGGGQIMTITLLLIPHIQGGQRHIAAVYSVLLIVVASLSLVIMESILKRYYRLENVWYG